MKKINFKNMAGVFNQKTEPQIKQKKTESSLLASGFCRDCSDLAQQSGIGKNKGMIFWCRRKTTSEKKYRWVYKRITDKIKVTQCPNYEQRKTGAE